MTRPGLALSLALVSFLAFTPAAGADSATVVLRGDPLEIIIGSQGGLQAKVDGTTSNVFHPPSAPTGNAGFFLGFPSQFGSFAPGMVTGPPNAGPTKAPWTEVSQGSVGGSGTKDNPLTQVTDYKLDDGSGAVVSVTQAISYTNGERRFMVAYALRNQSSGPVRFRASTGADLFLKGNDVGVGFFSAGPPRLVGGINLVTGVAGGIEEDASAPFLPWSHFMAGDYTSVFSAISDPSGGGFADTITRRAVDNGVGVQWDDHYVTGLAPGDSAAYSLAWNFGSPPPTVGRTANVEPVRGTVRVNLPSAPKGNHGRFVPLRRARQIPVGSILDTRRGTVAMTNASGAGGRTFSGEFAGGIFQVLQKRRRGAVTELRLVGGRFGRCVRGGAGRAIAARKRLSRRVARSLRAKAGGPYRTRGRESAATVRGTNWSTVDRCDGTVTVVGSGAVAVRDFRRRKTVVVRTGGSYIARSSLRRLMRYVKRNPGVGLFRKRQDPVTRRG